MSRSIVRFDEAGEVFSYTLRPSDEWATRCWRAMMLSNSLEVCRSLLAGEGVPLDRLDRDWVRKFGRRSR